MPHAPAQHLKFAFFSLLGFICLALAVFEASPARSAQSAPPTFHSLISTCMRLLDSDQGISNFGSFERLGFRQPSAINPYGGREYAIGPSKAATQVLVYEARGVREKEQYTFRPAIKGTISALEPQGSPDEWTISPLSQGSDGHGKGFFILYPELGVSRQQLEKIFENMLSFASVWTNSMIDTNTWVCDFVQASASGSRLSCYYSMDYQGRYRVSVVIRKDAPVSRQPLRDRGQGPHKAGSPDSFIKGIGLF